MNKAALLLLVLSGCSTISLRPIQRDHALRLLEVQQRLGVTPDTLTAALVLPQAACDSLDGKVTAWTATSVVVGALSGGSGLTSIFVDSPGRYVTGGIGVGLAATAALSAYLSTHYSQRYARQCAINTGGQ